MKIIIKSYFFVLLFCSSCVFGQAPDIDWQNDIGGNDYDQLQSIGLTSDGGFIVGGKSLSDISGDKSYPGSIKNDKKGKKHVRYLHIESNAKTYQ